VKVKEFHKLGVAHQLAVAQMLTACLFGSKLSFGISCFVSFSVSALALTTSRGFDGATGLTAFSVAVKACTVA
jgi:hypothetical protein